ncbi:transposable element Tcb2 transposase [Trichonephila clavipes]|nr:transposable element Tcb2 transposase [Trichonephila clavipes]
MHMGKKYLLTIAIPDYRPSIENLELSSPVQHNASPNKNSRTTVMMSFLDVTGIKQCPDLSPNQNALRFASVTEPTLIRKEDSTPLTVVQFLCSLHHCERWRRWSTFNGRQSSGRRCRLRARPPPTFLTAVPVVWNAFQERETTLLLIPNSAATLVTVRPYSTFPIILPRVKSSSQRKHGSFSCLGLKNESYPKDPVVRKWNVKLSRSPMERTPQFEKHCINPHVAARMKYLPYVCGQAGKKKYDACRRQIYRPISKRTRRTTAQQVANQFLAASGKQISRKTVARRLRGGGLYARRPVVCVPLTRQHRTARLQWCREHHNCTEQDWACVLFSDESRFSLSSDCRGQLIWRESGTAYRPENIQEKDRYPTCSIMVWAGIMINGRTRLHVVANGTMTGQRYIDEVLLPHVRLFRGAVCDKFVFMDDNATRHRTLAVLDCLDSEGIQRLVWPACSPDLNPIENVWDALGRQVAGRNYPPTNKNTLIRAVTEEWDKLPQQLLDNVVQSMVRRVECCITLHRTDTFI